MHFDHIYFYIYINKLSHKIFLIKKKMSKFIMISLSLLLIMNENYL